MSTKYCNGCKNCMTLPHPSYGTENWRCNNDESVIGNTTRVIAVNVKPEDLVARPMWCPLNKECNMGKEEEKPVKTLWEHEYQKKLTTKERWNAIDGLMEWDDIKIGESYHMPPTAGSKRTNFSVTSKSDYVCTCTNLATNYTFWLYKVDGYFKFLSQLKK